MKRVATIVAVCAALAVVLALAGWRVLGGTGPAAPPVSGVVDVNLPAPYLDSVQPGGTRYAAGGTKQRLEDAVAQAFADASMGDPGLVELALRRTDMLFAPDFDRWAAYSAQRPGVSGWSAPSGEKRARWERQASAFANPVVDADRVRVERVDPSRASPEEAPGTLWVGPDVMVSAPLPRPAEFQGTNAKAVEVFVPATIKDGNGDEMSVTVSFVFVDRLDGRGWEELNAYVYIGGHGFSRPIPMPPI